MRIELYAMCLDEMATLPFFLRHYRGIVDRFHIYDNGSVDGSIEYLQSQPDCEVHPFVVEGDSFVESARVLMDHVWKASRGVADWVIVCEVDEHLHHPDILGYLADCSARGVTAVRATGYDMLSFTFPPPGVYLPNVITRGVRHQPCDKLAAFRPDKIEETYFTVGRHDDKPPGDVNIEFDGRLTLLHYKRLGIDYLLDRKARLKKGLRPHDLHMGWGGHYTEPDDAGVRPAQTAAWAAAAKVKDGMIAMSRAGRRSRAARSRHIRATVALDAVTQAPWPPKRASTRCASKRAFCSPKLEKCALV